jgi:hypothetical protein
MSTNDEVRAAPSVRMLLALSIHPQRDHPSTDRSEKTPA